MHTTSQLQILQSLHLTAPPSSHERIAQIAKDAEGFVYCVSSLGVTGTRTNITTDIGAMVKLVKQAKDIPCAVGFGISTPEQAKKMAAQSDGNQLLQLGIALQIRPYVGGMPMLKKK